MYKVLMVAILCLTIINISLAAEIKLKDGSILKGEIIGSTVEEIEMETSFGAKLSLKKDDIKTITAEGIELQRLMVETKETLTELGKESRQPKEVSWNPDGEIGSPFLSIGVSYTSGYDSFREKRTGMETESSGSGYGISLSLFLPITWNLTPYISYGYSKVSSEDKDYKHQGYDNYFSFGFKLYGLKKIR